MKKSNRTKNHKSTTNISDKRTNLSLSLKQNQTSAIN